MTEIDTAPKRVEVFTDGACSGNPGPGGWGAILRYNGVEKELSGGHRDTTNNRMEMMAVVMALESLTRPCVVHICTDSRYVIDGVEKWLDGWKKRGWKTAGREPVKNAELWKRLDAAVRAHTVTFEWVKGHAGHVENERVDELARRQIENFR